MPGPNPLLKPKVDPALEVAAVPADKPAGEGIPPTAEEQDATGKLLSGQDPETLALIIKGLMSAVKGKGQPQ